MIDEFVRYAAIEWAVVTGAPVAFSLAVILAAAAIWWAISWAYKARLANAKSEISLRDAQIADYKEKLHGASPAEAKARMAALEAQLAALLAAAPKGIGPEIVPRVGGAYIGGRDTEASIGSIHTVGDSSPLVVGGEGVKAKVGSITSVQKK
jgi:hypothetical protein